VTCPNLQVFRFQEGLDILQEQLILKNATGKYNRIGPVLAA